jgi:DNA polymerase-1
MVNNVAFCDLESDSLKATVIWCIVARMNGVTYSFQGPTLKEDFIKFSSKVDRWVFHNGISFDVPTINRLFEQVVIPFDKVRDTLVLSKLFMPIRNGGHSLEAWGERLGYPKLSFHDFSQFTPLMLEYCIRDVEVTEKLYNHLLTGEGKGFSELSIRLEHKVRELIDIQERNGFYLDQNLANQLFSVTKNRMGEIADQIHRVFKPKSRPFNKAKPSVSPKYKKDGSLSTVGLSRLGEQWELVEGDFSPFWFEEFNVGSVPQIKERLFELGWKPTRFGKPTALQLSKGVKVGSPIVDEETMGHFAEESGLPEIRLFAEYLMVRSRHATVKQWLDLVDEESRVHGRVDPQGARTARMTHNNPNMANVAATPKDREGNILYWEKGNYGYESRACWTVPKGKILVGADASGIQLRALAHYMNDPEYIKDVCEGDVHTRNQKAAGLPTRDNAKTFIYAWLLGAGDAKIGTIIGQGAKEGAAVKERFLDALPALKELKHRIHYAAKKGSMLGLDGRKLWIPSEHLAMSLYLQGFEAVVMKMAMCIFSKELTEKGIPFKQVGIIHDEFQVETEMSYGDIVGATITESIKKAGVLLKSNCPLKGDYKLGPHWGLTH